VSHTDVLSAQALNIFEIFFSHSNPDRTSRRDSPDHLRHGSFRKACKNDLDIFFVLFYDENTQLNKGKISFVVLNQDDTPESTRDYFEQLGNYHLLLHNRTIPESKQHAMVQVETEVFIASQ
jgi:hypothetical protein